MFHIANIQNFSKFLHNSFKEFDNKSPILISLEIENTKNYINIENIKKPKFLKKLKITDLVQLSNNIRKYISIHYDEFCDALNKSGMTIGGEKLKTMPRGFSADDPAAEYIKHKCWEMIFHIPDVDIGDFDEFSDLLIFYVKKMEPMRLFLLKAAQYVDNKRPEFEW